MISRTSRSLALPRGHGPRAAVLLCVIAVAAIGTWWVLVRSYSETASFSTSESSAKARPPAAASAPERSTTEPLELAPQRANEFASPPRPASPVALEQQVEMHSGLAAVGTGPPAVLAYERGKLEQDRGGYEAALQSFLEALELDPENTDYMVAAGRMAGKIGNLEEAVALFKRALVVQEHALGPDDPSVANTFGELGNLYRDQQLYSEAEAAYQQALAINETAYGEQHFQVASALSDLAILYQIEGRYGEAIPLLENALEIEEHVWGPQHPNVASRSSSLGILYQQEGRYEDVEALLERTLFLREQTFGVDHPNTTGALTSLADFYRDQERYVEAESLLLRTLSVHESRLERNDPRLAMDLADLGELYVSQSQFTQAQPYYERALRIENQAQWSETPQVSVGLIHAARTAGNEGRHEEAVGIFRWALSVSESALGPDNANTIYLRDQYTQYLHIHGRSDELNELNDG